MHAALKMCIELDQAGKIPHKKSFICENKVCTCLNSFFKGELADNLTILSKEELIAPHYNLKEDEEENLKSNAKVGTTKHKRIYKAAVRTN